MSATDLATVITALTTLVAAIGALIQSMRNGREIGKVHGEVTTANGATLAALADASESRRIVALVPGRRTEEELEHLLNVPPKPHAIPQITTDDAEPAT